MNNMKVHHKKSVILLDVSKSFLFVLLSLSLFVMLFSSVGAAASNVMLVEAEASSLVIPSGDWQVVEDDGLVSIVSSQSGSGFEVDIFGTEFSLKAKNADSGGDDIVFSVVVDDVPLDDVVIELGAEDYQQVLLVGGMDNAEHVIKVSVLSGAVAIDKVVMGASSEIPAPAPRVAEDYYTKASFNRPWIFQDAGGMYWMTMEIQSLSQNGDMYITNSDDGVSWSKPAPVVTGIYHEYDSATVIDDEGEFWMVFTRMEPPENKSALKTPSKTVNTPYYTHSTDGITWDEPQRIVMPQDNAYYPYLFYDADADLFIYLYASSSVTTGEFHDNVYVITSKSMGGISGGTPLQITDDSMKSSYYPTLIKDDEGEYWLYFVSPKFQDEEVFLNHNDIFVMHSSDLVEWSEPSLVTDANVSVAYNYLDPAYSNGEYYLSIMSSQVLTEDAYIMRSDDGVTFTEPERMIDHDDGNIIDYKSMFADSEGVLWMAYSHVMDEGNRAVYVVKSSDGIVWNEPIRVSPESNIFGEFWLASEPKPESVIEVEGATSDLVNIPHAKEFSVQDLSDASVDGDADAEGVGDVPQSGLSTTLFVVLSLLFFVTAKRNG